MAKTYSAIQTIVCAGGETSVTFNNIPQNYTDLKIVYSARGLAAATDRGMFVQFNGDTTSSYTYKFLRGDGSSAGSGGTTTTFLYWGNFPAASATANTFGNGEFYIPNYTSSNYKSVSSDSVSENNATAGWDTLVAGLWSKTNAITSMLLYPESGNFAQYSTFTLYGISAGARATGGTVTGSGNYIYHTFLSTGSFIPTEQIRNAEVLCIAGGGGGSAAGGGAGGLVYTPGLSLNAGTQYSCTVGAGGAGTAGGGTTLGTNGVNSSFTSSITATGGGGGAYAGGNIVNGAAGGSGGGGFAGGGTTSSSSGIGGSGTSGQGNNGGNSYVQTASTSSTGGGGGAGGIGGTATGTNTGGNGGIGSSSYTAWGQATNTGHYVGGTFYYAGGGGGGDYVATTSGLPGLGGGGYGSNLNNTGSAGLANTGGGGGGAYNTTYTTGYTGGSGLIIVRYPIN